MGAERAEIDGWLRGGGRVVAASERAARAVVAAYHRARQADGLSAWPAPLVQDWKSFVQSAWQDMSSLGAADARLLLNPLQEQSLWEQIAGQDRREATLLESSCLRLAGLAMEAHALLCAYAPRFLRAPSRAGWPADAGVFSGWLSSFDDACRAGKLLSPARLPFELIPRLEQNSSAPARPPLLLVGFDRIVPVQRALLDAWGLWQQAALGEPVSTPHFHEARDTQQELTACSRWCNSQLAVNPGTHLLIVAQQASDLRGQIERAFLRHVGPTSLVEFSLGIPLSQVDLARGAHLLLRWLSQPLAEHELDWLFSTGHVAASPNETFTLQKAMRAVRDRSQQRPAWTLDAFLHWRTAAAHLPASWVSRMQGVAQSRAELSRRTLHPIEWAELVPQLLHSAGWPGGRSLSSAEHQAADRWQQTVETCGSLGFDGRRIDWSTFLATLARTLDATLFDPESRNAPILVAGPAESAGLSADAIWFLGADEEAWPSRETTHPFLPLPLQREAGMPHATAQLDWDLARSISARLLASAPNVHFSYARQKDGSDTRPSRLIQQFAGPPGKLCTERFVDESQTVLVEDRSRIPFTQAEIEGGSAVLTAQSQCPFKAFATARLGAHSWEAAQPGLTAAQRGQLLHAVLRSVWAGPPHGIRSLAELQARTDLRAFVAEHVDCVFFDALPAGLRERMPQRYLELEKERLIQVITGWLSYEATRADFTVLDTEAKRTLHLAGLTFSVRPDRIDRLNDDSLLVIDYKSGNVSPRLWDLPRPDDVQLPLYAEFALDPDAGELGGLVFAKVRAGEPKFAGFVRDAETTLLPALNGRSNLVRDKLTDEQLGAWRTYIEQLALDFLAGDAQVDPREYPQTCERCGLQSLCRVTEPENQSRLTGAEDALEDEELADD